MAISARIAVVAPGTNLIEIKDVELPAPGPYQVVVNQHATGVCHSQLHQIHRERAEPLMLGHESTGTVEAVGSAVEHVRVGDEVMVTWIPRSPQPTYRQPESAGLTFADGTVAVSQNVFSWGTHAMIDEQYIVKSPEGTPADFGSIIGCAVMTGAGAVLRTAEVSRGQSVAIWGVGGVGLSAIAAARNAGANPIIAVDLDDSKLEFAKRFGATHGVNAKQVDAVEEVRRLTPGDRPTDLGGVDWAFDCIGRSISTQQAIASAHRGHAGETRGATAVLVGVPTEPVEVNSGDMLTGEKRFIGSLGGSCIPERDFPIFVEWFRTGKLELDQLVTARYRLDDINQACADLEAGKISGRAIVDLTLD